MIFFEMDLLIESPDLRTVLAAYHAEEQAVTEAHAAARKAAKKAEPAEEPPEADASEDEEAEDATPETSYVAENADERWIPRLASVEGVEEENLAVAHGRLIAYGLLKFKLMNRAGVGYQLTSLGRRGVELEFEQQTEDEEAFEERDAA